MRRERFVWEEIAGVPCIYRISRTDSDANSYVFLHKDEALIIDPRSEKMLRNICRLACGLGARPEKVRVYMTDSYDEKMREVIENMPCEMELYCRRDKENVSGREDPGIGENEEMMCRADGGEPAGKRPGERTMGALTLVRDGDSIRIGNKILQVISLEGGRRGLTGLWVPEAGILFSGEAVRIDRLPGVRNWDPRTDMMALQLEMLRRVRGLDLRCILTGSGPCAGVDQLPEDRSERPDKITPDCAAILDSMLEQYCMRILEVYQKIPVSGGISARMIDREGTGPEGVCAESCLRYLLYRKYIVRQNKEDEEIYERGSMRLTDWNLGGGE